MERSQLQPGTVLAEKYRLESVLGVGGMGTVYRAEHLALKAPVAVKVIDREVSDGDIALSRFMREAQAAAALRSPHVVQILDYGSDGDRPFMVMELLEGEPLADRIERFGKLTAGETYRVINHVAKAVAKAHEADIIHRDLKPDNVFLVHNEGDEVAKVLDFGVAKVEATALDGDGHTRTGSLLGTPYYMSPEQAQGNKDIDARSDLWALGVIAFECMTGKRPFSSDGLGDLVLQICIREIPLPSQFAEVPPAFDQWFVQACKREPMDRFQSARELAEGLRQALEIGNDGGIPPESRWSAVASLPQTGATQAGKAVKVGSVPQDGAGDDTTAADERPTRASQRPTRDVEAEVERERAERLAAEQSVRDESPEGAAPASDARASRWEVVPHGETENEPSRASFADTDIDEYSPIPKSSGVRIFVVAVAALLAGGVAMIAAKKSELLPWEQPKPSAPKTPTWTKPSTEVATESSQSAETPTPGDDGSANPRQSKGAGKTRATQSTDGEDEEQKLDEIENEAQQEEVGQGEADSLESPSQDESTAENAEEAAETANEDQGTAEGEDEVTPSAKGAKGSKGAGEGAKSDEPDSGDSPSPTLPDGLAPAPKPPPPSP